MKTEERLICDLRLDPRNARSHSKRNLQAIAKSLAAFGQQKPIVITADGLVVAGNGTVEAARELGWQKLQVVVTTLENAQRLAYAVADNQAGALADWNETALAETLLELRADGDIDELATGFTVGEIDRYAAVLAGEEPEDEPLKAPLEPRTQPGDTWILGAHRLRCGDSTNGEDVAALFTDAATPPFLMVTDPPYGVEYDPAWRNKDFPGAPGARREGTVTNDHRVGWEAAYRLFRGDVAYVWCASSASPEVAADLDDIGMERRFLLIWRKQHFAISRGHYHWQHEACWYAVRKGRTARWCGDRKQSTIWDIGNHCAFGGGTEDEDEDTDHGTQKPIECMARPIRNHGEAGDVVYDPFLGSGTTLIACQRLERICYAMEIDPGYCDVAVARWEKLTGKEATRA